MSVNHDSNARGSLAGLGLTMSGSTMSYNLGGAYSCSPLSSDPDTLGSSKTRRLDKHFCASLLGSRRNKSLPPSLPSHFEPAYVMATQVKVDSEKAPTLVTTPVEHDDLGEGAPTPAFRLPRQLTSRGMMGSGAGLDTTDIGEVKPHIALASDDEARGEGASTTAELLSTSRKARRKSTIQSIEQVATKDPHRGASIVLCFDGTGEHYDSDLSNVANIFSALKKGDSRQPTYYQSGVGTYPTQSRAYHHAAPAVCDMMFGVGIDEHIKQGYRFLMQHYRSLEDRISMFGFSRGAYTARALAAMIPAVGLLPSGNHQQIEEAFRIYKATLKGVENLIQAREFKRLFSIPVRVWFVGCWDTVSSIGIIPKELPKTNADVDIQYFRHCLALDEHRGKFEQRNWIECTHRNEPIAQPFTSRFNDEGSGTGSNADHSRNGSEVAEDHQPQQVLETWFAGSHADVGGGATRFDTPFALSRITLRWMIRQSYVCDTRILFKESELRKIGFRDPAALVDLRNLEERDDHEMPHQHLIEQARKAKSTFQFGDKSSGQVVTIPNVVGTSDELVDVVDAVAARDLANSPRYLDPLPRKEKDYPSIEPRMHWTVKLREAFGLLHYRPLAELESRPDGPMQWIVVDG